jgi:predicted ATPase
MREGLELLREQQVHNNLRLFYVLLAEIEADSDRLEAGLATLDAQHEIIERSGERWFHAEVHRARGELLLRNPSANLDAAETAFRRAIEIARSQQTRTFELRSAVALARLYQATGRSEAVRELLTPAVADFSEGPELPEVEQANRLLADLVSNERTQAR